MENYGIENLKTASVKILNIVDSVNDNLKDGDFDFADIMALITQVPNMLFVVNHFDEIKQEVIDLSAEESAELCDYIREEVNFGEDDERLLDLIIASIDLIGTTYAKIIELVNIYKQSPIEG